MMIRSKILNKIKAQHKKSGGHCGLYVTDFKGPGPEIIIILKKLLKEKEITHHDGIHGVLVKYKSEFKKPLQKN